MLVGISVAVAAQSRLEIRWIEASPECDLDQDIDPTDVLIFLEESPQHQIVVDVATAIGAGEHGDGAGGYGVDADAFVG